MTSTNHNTPGQIVKAEDGWIPKDRHGIPFKRGETVYSCWQLGRYKVKFEPNEVVGLDDRGFLITKNPKGEEVINCSPNSLTHFDREISRENFIVNILAYLEDIYDAMPDADKEIIDNILADADVFGYDRAKDPHHSLYP